MKVPFIDLGPVVDLIDGEEFDFPRHDVRKRIDAREFVGGPTVTKLETALAKALDVKHAVTCGSGTDALVLALMAAGIGRGHYVALPNLTFWATYEAVVRVGATPVLLDVDETLQLSLDELYKSDKSRPFDAAILVHLFGWCSPRLEEFRQYCLRKRITLIEDGAQAFGVSSPEDATVSVFKGAHISTLSFYPAKIIGGIGDGGAVLTNSDHIAERVHMLANHGRSAHYQHTEVGLCSRMSGIEAAWLLRAVAESAQILDVRRDALHDYVEALSYFDGDADFTTTRIHGSLASNGYLCVLEVDDRDAVRAKLAERGIETAVTYPVPISLQRGTTNAIVVGNMTRSTRFCERVLNLPLFYGITDEQINYVIENVKDVVK